MLLFFAIDVFNLHYVNRQEAVCNEFHLLSDPTVTITTPTIAAEENAYLNEASGNNRIVVFDVLFQKLSNMFNRNRTIKE